MMSSGRLHVGTGRNLALLVAERDPCDMRAQHASPGRHPCLWFTQLPRLHETILGPGDAAPFPTRACGLDETVLITRFLDEEAGQSFCAAVTHLYYHPSHPDLKVCACRGNATSQGHCTPVFQRQACRCC